MKRSQTVPQVLARLQGLNASKSEFESTESFHARLTDAIARRMPDSDREPLALNIAIHPWNMKYDADVGAMKFWFTPGRFFPIFSMMADDLRGSVPYIIASVSGDRTISSYTGANAFGVERTVTRERSDHAGITISGMSAFGGWPSGFRTDLALPMASTEARKAKTRLAVLMVGNLELPYLSKGKNMHPPTLEEPWNKTYYVQTLHLRPVCAAIVNVGTREVLHPLPVI